MASKKKTMVKQCRIYQWIEKQDSDFAEAIRDLCLEGALSPGGRSVGVTFLYPKDKAYRQEIIEKAYSADADEAVKLVESLIIPAPLISGADFNRAPVGSRLGVAYAVESADNKQVKLAGGVELALAEDFHPLARRAGDIAVWIVTKGRLPLAGEAYKAPRPGRSAKGGAARHGGAEAGMLGSRPLLAAAVELEFDRCMLQGNGRAHNPYLAKVVSLLCWLRAKSADTYLKVLPVIDYDPVVTFYLLVEPYKTSGEPLIPGGLLFGDDGWNGAEMYDNAAADYEAVFSGLASQQGASASDAQGAPAVPYVFRDRAAAAARVDAVRQRLANQNPRQWPKLVQDAYAALAAQNAIQGMGPILPDVTLRALPAAKKLWQDELRFTLHEALQSLRAAPYATSTFASIVRDLRLRWPGNNYAAELAISNVADLQATVAPRLELLLLSKFVNSTDFLYLPAAPEAVGGAWGSMDPSDQEVYNRNAVALGTLRRVTGMVRAAGVSPQALQELRMYVQAHGQLPPDVLSLAAAQ